jgi:hypothetical protein
VGAGKGLSTWGKHGRFTYQGSVERGTKVLYGRGSTFTVTAEQYASLLALFAGRLVDAGNSRRPARGSLGSWLRAHVGVELAAAYVGPILVHEGLAERQGDMVLFPASAGPGGSK